MRSTLAEARPHLPNCAALVSPLASPSAIARRHLSRAQGQQDSGRVERIEKAEGVTDEDPSVACNGGRAHE
jgi:hypothetical protein